MIITLELGMHLQNIWWRVVGNVMINISLSNIFLNMLLTAKFHQNYQAVLGVVSINGLHCDELLMVERTPEYQEKSTA